MKTLSLLAAAGLCALAAAPAVPASAGQSQPRQCFDSRNINGFSAPDDKTVNLRIGVNDVYRLELQPGCSGLDFVGMSIGVRNRGGSSFICDALDAQIIVPDRQPNRCDVKSIVKLTADEVKALPPKAKP